MVVVASLPAAAAKADIAASLAALKEPHLWILAVLYIGTFGSFTVFAGVFPKLLADTFPDFTGFTIATATATLAFLGALVGSLARPYGGTLADRFGGTRITIGAFTAMGLGILSVIRRPDDSLFPRSLSLPSIGRRHDARQTPEISSEISPRRTADASEHRILRSSAHRVTSRGRVRPARYSGLRTDAAATRGAAPSGPKVARTLRSPTRTAQSAHPHPAPARRLPHMTDAPAPPGRTAVVAAAIALFAERGYDQTSVEQIAQAAGVSRSTFFRQFGGKEDVVFADHEVLIDETRAFLAQQHDDPWAAVCDASMRVFRHFAADPELARRRYAIVREVPVLRDREIVTVFRYERLFDEYLRETLPGLDPLDAVGFAALVTAVHNHVLRRLMRGARVPASTLRRALDDVLRRYGVHPDGDDAAGDDLIVAAFPRRMPAAEVTRRLRASLPH